jgi:hypothetical protein
VLGVKAYPSLTAVPDQIDLAVVVTPAPSVPAIMRECVQKRVKGAIVISAGFKEAGPEGVALEREVKQQVALGGMRLIGPNCLGVMSPLTGLNATFAAGMARPGNVAFMSQSGALCTAVLDWSLRENVGFSAFASLGSMLDVSWGDLIEYLGRDPDTHSIIIYMETIGDARTPCLLPVGGPKRARIRRVVAPCAARLRRERRLTVPRKRARALSRYSRFATVLHWPQRLEYPSGRVLSVRSADPKGRLERSRERSPLDSRRRPENARVANRCWGSGGGLPPSHAPKPGSFPRV